MIRRYAHGAEVSKDGGVHFRVWAPNARRVDLVLEPRGASVAMEKADAGFFEAFVRDARAGTRYAYRVDGEGPFPDPASPTRLNGSPAV